MNARTFTVTICVVLMVILSIACFALQPVRDTAVKVFMLNVGQGDSFLVQTAQGKQLLIDSGRDASVLAQLAKVMPAGDTSIDAIIATHPDADHIGGLASVLERYSVGLFLTSQVDGTSTVYRELFGLIDQKKIPAYYVRHGMDLSLDNKTVFSVLFPDRPTSNWETNTASVVGRLDVANPAPSNDTSSILFTGDSPSTIEHMLAQTVPDMLTVDVLKLGHHGSKTSSSAEFLTATHPQLALISAGVGNSYGHPHTEVFDRLKEQAIPWVSTQDKGTVELESVVGGWEVR